MAHPDEIAAAALFLASEESGFVNGSELFVDGARRRFERRPVAERAALEHLVASDSPHLAVTVTIFDRE